MSRGARGAARAPRAGTLSSPPLLIAAALLTVGAAPLLVAGCASASGGDGTEGPVPVYTAAADVPCEFERLTTVVVEVPTLPLSGFEDRLARRLGRAGRRQGADAVLYGESERRLSFSERRSGAQRQQVHGSAIRFVESGCPGGADRR